MPHSVLVERISFLAKQKGISLKKLQRQLGMSTSTIYSWDNSSPLLNRVIPFAKYFDVSLDFLCGLDEYSQTKDYPPRVRELLHTIYTLNLTDAQAAIIIEYLRVLRNFNYPK